MIAHAAAQAVVSYLAIAVGFFFLLRWERNADPGAVMITDDILAVAALLWLPFCIDIAFRPKTD